MLIQIELANLNKSIQDNTKIIFELENEGLAIASENSKKWKQINELKTEIGELESKKVIIQRSLKERNTNLKAKFETNKANVEWLISLINEKEKLKEIYSKKIEVLQQNFSKAELFLLKLLPVYERLEIAFNEGQGISTDPSKRAVEYNMVEVLKTQFNKSLNY